MTATSTDQSLVDRLFERLSVESRRLAAAGGERHIIELAGEHITIPSTSGLDELHLDLDSDTLACYLADAEGSAWSGSTRVFTVKVNTSGDEPSFELIDDLSSVEQIDGQYRNLFKALDPEIGNVLSEAVRRDNHRLMDIISSRENLWLVVDYDH